METISDRVKRLRDLSGLTQEDLGKRVGVTQQAIQKLEDGGVSSPRYLLKLAAVLKCDPEWLLSGDDPKASAAFDNIMRPPNTQSPGRELNPEENGYIAVQRVRLKLSAGVTGYEVEPDDQNGKPIFFRKDFLEQKNWKPDKLFAFRVNGASMEPRIFDQDVIVINTASTQPVDGEVFAVNYEGEMVIKRLKRDAAAWWLACDNPDKTRFPDKICHEGVVIIGRGVYLQTERL